MYGLTYLSVLVSKVDTISYTAARANLASTMAHVCIDHAPIIITRKSEAPVVMMSLEDYNAM
jgi:antitoxin YefM